MKTAELERLLQAGPPDEPASVRSLEFPAVPVEAVRRHGLDRHAAWPAPRTLAASALGVVLVAIALGTAVRLGVPHGAGGDGAGSVQIPGASPAPSPGTATTAGPSLVLGGAETVLPGVAARVPVGWHVVALDEADGEPRAALVNFDADAACGASPTWGCLEEHRLMPGEILVTFRNDDNAHTIAEVMAPTGPDAVIGGMPAVVQIAEAPPGTDVTGIDVPPGCDAHRAWWIGRPTSATGWLAVDACSARANRVAFERTVDGVATSVQFAATPEPRSTAP